KLYKGFDLVDGMPTVSLTENISWEEELVPSHVTKSSFPVRLFTCNISNNQAFNDSKLIGYDVEFHASAKEYIQNFLSLPGGTGSKEIREGMLMLELEDKKGAIKLDGSVLSIEGKNDNLCLVGKIDDGRPVSLKQGRMLEIEQENIQRIELWLLNKDEDVLDFWSSSEWPYIYLQPGQEGGGINYERIIEAGEGSICEFKPYMSFKEKQNSKIDQITRTVCAFSNSKGGTLFIGVNDNAEIEDITASLRKDYKGDVNSSLISYTSDLKALLKDNLLYNQCVNIQTVKVFSKLLIIVNVSQLQDINYVKSERQSYVRKGASSMKMLPEEVRVRNKHGDFN
ncbi:MAG: ATP-binding protein, partial [Alphaproteobacteria bacterium]|nr:ATP-binding protein [Alphaproteobacteria bacterium]